MHRTLAVLISCSAAWAQAQTVGIWTHPTTALLPPGRTEALMAFDAARGRTVMAGGVTAGPYDDSVYEYDGSTWRSFTPAHPLVFHTYAVRMCYSPLRGKVVAVRSATSIGPNPILTYEWNGADWVQLATTNTPSSRSDAFEVTWDEARNVLVLFGGGASWADTWEWNGSAWTQRGTGGPPGRRFHCMAYDVARQRTVLYGGTPVNGGGNLTDTWEWDGVVWRERFGMTPPPLSGNGIGIAYDRQRQRTVLYGGINSQTNLASSAVYDYDGNSWTQLLHLGNPPATFRTALSFDARRNRMVAFGGTYGSGTMDTWEMEVRTGFVASFGQHGAGCAGPAGIATLTAVNSSRPQLGASLQLRYGSLPNTPLALVFATLGFDDQNWNGTPLPFDLGVVGMPGCMLRLWPDFIQLLANTGGVADWTLPVPASPALDGLPFFVQGAVLSTGSNAAGIVVSNSGRGVMGAL